MGSNRGREYQCGGTGLTSRRCAKHSLKVSGCYAGAQSNVCLCLMLPSGISSASRRHFRNSEIDLDCIYGEHFSRLCFWIVKGNEYWIGLFVPCRLASENPMSYTKPATLQCPKSFSARAHEESRNHKDDSDVHGMQQGSIPKSLRCHTILLAFVKPSSQLGLHRLAFACNSWRSPARVMLESRELRQSGSKRAVGSALRGP